MEAERARNNRISFRLTDEELDLIRKKMTIAGIVNREAYLRKMALDGRIIRLDVAEPELRNISSLLRYLSNNLNQIARRVNESGRLYAADLQDIRESQECLCDLVRDMVGKLSALLR